MRGRFVLVALALLVGGALPAVAAAPFGFFDGKVPFGNGAHGLMPFTGWALDDNGVASVDVLVDDVVVLRALYGLRRPQVTRRFPGFPDTARPGYVGYLDTTRFLNGTHQVRVLITSKTGEETILGPRTIHFLNAAQMLAPFGLIEFPHADAVLRGRCSADPTRRFSVITGQALDAGSGENAHDVGVGYVELMVDGSIIFNSKTSCLAPSNPGAAGPFYTNCYGLPSNGWTAVYPSLPDSDRATFRFGLDVGALVLAGWSPGSHKITIRAGDISPISNVSNIASINVFFECDEDIPNEKAIAGIENPNQSQPWAGTIGVTGWAIDFDGVQRVEVRVNDQIFGNATYGFGRPDVANLYPGYPTSPGTPSGYGFIFSLDTTVLADGEQTLEIWVYDNAGDATLAGEVKFTVANSRGT
ncbi:MAG TPA: hypothetical protein VGV61_03440 [Thermoanaerobaculia bacterium]|jgi:hypothetical protein|nr:hypothetical protein [Thermoanaerobaculia bacterium]